MDVLSGLLKLRNEISLLGLKGFSAFHFILGNANSGEFAAFVAVVPPTLRYALIEFDESGDQSTVCRIVKADAINTTWLWVGGDYAAAELPKAAPSWGCAGDETPRVTIHEGYTTLPGSTLDSTGSPDGTSWGRPYAGVDAWAWNGRGHLVPGGSALMIVKRSDASGATGQFQGNVSWVEID